MELSAIYAAGGDRGPSGFVRRQTRYVTQSPTFRVGHWTMSAGPSHRSRKHTLIGMRARVVAVENCLLMHTERDAYATVLFSPRLASPPECSTALVTPR